MLGAPFWRVCRGAAGSDLHCMYLHVDWGKQSATGAGAGAGTLVVQM